MPPRPTGRTRRKRPPNTIPSANRAGSVSAESMGSATLLAEDSCKRSFTEHPDRPRHDHRRQGAAKGKFFSAGGFQADGGKKNHPKGEQVQRAGKRKEKLGSGNRVHEGARIKH